ncbi:methyltransferase domain-containing protein [Candidatus Giovannonibacteria bacterium]|nr:methyltransferase domain-containing protein [Candidatus Giovannonibacteria bacterium]
MQNGKPRMVVVGFGWVGQANAIALTKMGEEVYYYDVVPPVFRYVEFEDLYKKIQPLASPLEKDSVDTSYIVCVGDKVSEEGAQDLSLIKKALDSLKETKGKIILRSTVLPQSLRELNFHFYLPEFLHEKHAVEECLNPQFFVLGAKTMLQKEPEFFDSWRIRSNRVFTGTPEQASYIKYLSNIWNALRVAFVNEFGDLTQDSDVIDFIFEKKSYLRYGKSFGGHCLPKDLRAFARAFRSGGRNMVMEAAYKSNLAHREFEKKNELPEWFSSWADERQAMGDVGTGIFLWNKLNSLRGVQLARKKFRFLSEALTRVIPDRDLSDVRDIWNKLAEKNARYYVNTKTLSGKDVSEFELRETGLSDYKKYIEEDKLLFQILNSKTSALEIGCGLGRMTEFFPKHFVSVAAIDISDAMLTSAKKRVADQRINYQISDGQSIPFKSNSFDLAFSYQALRHVPQKKALANYFKELYRTLNTGGIAKLHLRTGMGPYKWHWAYGVSLSPREAKQMAEAVGFKFIKHEIEDPKSLWIWLKK